MLYLARLLSWMCKASKNSGTREYLLPDSRNFMLSDGRFSPIIPSVHPRSRRPQLANDVTLSEVGQALQT